MKLFSQSRAMLRLYKDVFQHSVLQEDGSISSSQRLFSMLMQVFNTVTLRTSTICVCVFTASNVQL